MPSSSGPPEFYLFAFIGLMLMLTQGGLYQMLARRGVAEITFMLWASLLLMLGMAGLGGTARTFRPCRMPCPMRALLAFHPGHPGHRGDWVFPS